MHTIFMPDESVRIKEGWLNHVHSAHFEAGSLLTELKHLRLAQYVSIQRCSSIDASSLRNVQVLHVVKCGGLQNIQTLMYLKELDVRGTLGVLPQASNLQTLRMSGNRLTRLRETFSIDIARPKSTLRHLQMSNKDFSIRFAQHYGQKLESLHLTSCHDVILPPIDLSQLKLVNCTNQEVNLDPLQGLEHVELDKWNLNEPGRLVGIETIETLTLNVCSQSFEANWTRTLHSIDLKLCLGITDVSSFAACHSVHLQSCPCITNIDSLRNVYELSLNQCQSLVSFSQLDVFHRLVLVECHNLTTIDFRALPHTLLLSKLRQLEPFESFGAIHTLSVEKCSLNLDAMRNVHTLDLSNNWDVSEIESLAKVHTLYLSNCLSVSNVKVLENLYHVDLSGCERLTNESIRSLSKVHTLNLSRTPISCVKTLGRVHTLSLADTMVSDVSMLGFVHWLDLSRCLGVVDVSALRYVHTLLLNGCINVSDVSALGNCHVLSLSNCTDLQDLIPVSKIHTLDLTNLRGS